ncbi:MAG: hypothetical protein IPK62_16485 [Bacteroidetes bacterium]|nr:hypothetical protein [Bacteroidota bacterium]
MKKLIVVSVTAFAFFAICTTVLLSSCQKKNVTTPSNQEAKKTRVENGRKYKVYYGIRQAELDGFSCLPSLDICHIEKYYEQNGEPWNIDMYYFPQHSLARIASKGPDEPLNDPIVVNPGTFLPVEFKLEYNIQNGELLPGVYPVIYDAENPHGYVDLRCIP